MILEVFNCPLILVVTSRTAEREVLGSVLKSGNNLLGLRKCGWIVCGSDKKGVSDSMTGDRTMEEEIELCRPQVTKDKGIKMIIQ